MVVNFFSSSDFSSLFERLRPWLLSDKIVGWLAGWHTGIAYSAADCEEARSGGNGGERVIYP